MTKNKKKPASKSKAKAAPKAKAPAKTSKGKPVFNAEYKKLWRDDANERAKMCTKAKSMNLRTLVLPLALNDAFRYSCD